MTRGLRLRNGRPKHNHTLIRSTKAANQPRKRDKQKNHHKSRTACTQAKDKANGRHTGITLTTYRKLTSRVAIPRNASKPSNTPQPTHKPKTRESRAGPTDGGNPATKRRSIHIRLPSTRKQPHNGAMSDKHWICSRMESKYIRYTMGILYIGRRRRPTRQTIHFQNPESRTVQRRTIQEDPGLHHHQHR